MGCWERSQHLNLEWGAIMCIGGHMIAFVGKPIKPSKGDTMIHRFSSSVGIIVLVFVLSSCSSAPPQVEVASTNVPPTETASPTLVPTLDLPAEELNEQMFEAIRADD